jgi:hypothetical protein
MRMKSTYLDTSKPPLVSVVVPLTTEQSIWSNVSVCLEVNLHSFRDHHHR